mgnify:CR=1 FL=1
MRDISRILAVLVSLFVTSALLAQTYEYPFQNPELSDDERIDNLLSLMTLEEKIATFSGLGVPRLGVADPGSSEAIHGLVRGGATDLENFVRVSQIDRTRDYTQQQAAPQLPLSSLRRNSSPRRQFGSSVETVGHTISDLAVLTMYLHPAKMEMYSYSIPRFTPTPAVRLPRHPTSVRLHSSQQQVRQSARRTLQRSQCPTATFTLHRSLWALI